MPVPVLSSLDFNRTELLNARLQNLAVDPSGLTSNEKGLLWIDSAGVIKYWDGAIVKELGLATGGNAESLDGQDGTYYLDRTNHTGTQIASTISDLNEAVDDRVSALILTSGDITKTYDDVVGSLTLAVDKNGGDAATLDGLDSAAFEKVSNKNVANGYAGLDGSGLIATSQLPALAITTTHVVADLVARDALTVQEGDVAVVTGTSESFIWDGTAWVELVSPTDGVQSVTGGTGINSTGGTNPTISVVDGGIDTLQLADLAVTAAKLAAGAVDLNSATTTGTLPIGKGGTGAATATDARTALGATGKVSTNIGDGINTEYTINHGLNTRDVTVEVYRNATPWDKVLVDVERPTLNDVLIRFAAVQSANAFRVVVVG